MYTYKRYPHPDGGDVFKVMHIAHNDGSTLDFTYRGSRLLLHTITDQSGRVIETVANKDNTHIAEVYYVNGGTRELQVRYDYDKQGNLSHVWDRKGKAIYFEYDAHNRLVRRTNRNGMEYVFEYDAQGRVVYTTGLNGFQQGRIKYYPELGYNEVIYPQLDNKKETYYYDENDLVYKIVDGEGGETWYDHTVHNERKMIASPEGSTQGYSYDEYGNISTYYTPDGEQYRYTYNEYGQLTARFEPSGVMELWMYDDRQRLVSYTNKLEEVTRYEYEDTMRLPAASTDVSGTTTCYTYNAQLQLVLLTNSSGLEQHWLYDAYGRVLTYIPRPMVQVQWQRDELGRVIRLTEPGEAPLTIEYDAYDLPVKATDGKQEWQMDYTPMGSLKKQVRREAISGRHEQTLRFSYDAYENLRNITNEKNEVYRFERNRNNEVVAETGFDGLTKKYVRNRDGLVTRTLLPQGKSIHYEYDLAGRLVHTRYHDGSWEAYQYDTSGMLIRADNDTASVAFTRNALGMLTEEKQGAHSIQYSYNKQGQLTHLGSSLGAEVAHDYDALGQLSHITAYNGQQGVAKDNTWQSLLRYNELGQLQQRQMSGGVDSSFEYDHTGMPISQKVNAQRQTRLHKDYRWAQGSRLMAVLDRLTGRSTEYSYDLYGSLSAAQYGDGSVQYKNPDAAGNLYETKDRKDRIYDKGGKLLKDKSWYYHYDEEGNLILKSKRNISGLTTGKQVQKQQEKEHPYRRSLSNVWTVQQEWKEADLPDAAAMAPPGEARWQNGDWEYNWYANGMLKSVKRPDGKTVAFEYDALGRRTAKIYNGEISRYLWDGNVILHEWKYNLNLRPKPSLIRAAL
jgi:YD repeat-containing protein